MRICRFLSLVALVTSLSALLWAQSATSSLSVTITDPKGAVLPGADLTLVDPATGFSRTAKTNSVGTFQFLQIPPAEYDLTVSASGFSTLKESKIGLLVNTPNALTIPMQVSAAGTTIEVTGAAPIVNTQDASMGNAFNTTQIAAL